MDSNVSLLPIIIVILYLIGMLAIGFFTNKYAIKSSTDYMLAGRSVGVVMIAASLSANNVGGGSTTGLAARAFSGWGMSASWYVLAAAIAMIPLAYFAPRIRKTMAITIPEVVHRRFGDFAGTFTAVLNVLSLFLLTSSQILASGSVLSVLVGIPLNLAIIIAAIVTGVYTVMGGMLADQISDLIQFFIILIGLAVSMFFVLQGVGGWGTIADMLPPVELDLFKVGWVTIIGLIFNYFCTFLSGPEMVSRFSSAEDEKTAQKAAVLSAIFMAMIAFLPTIMGLVALAENPGLDGGAGTSALMYTVQNYAPTWVSGVLAASIVAATMSSADSNLLSASSIIMNDIYLRYVNPNLEDRKVIYYARGMNVIILIISSLIAMLNISIVTLNLFAFALRSAGPIGAYGLGMVVDDATKNAGIASIVVGSVAVIFWQLMGEPFGILAIVFGSFWSAVAFMLVTKIERGRGVPPAPSAFEHGHTLKEELAE